MSQSPGWSAEALLAHEPFVRAVVRGMLADDASVRDVLQETWLRALRRAPRAEGAARTWLARVASNLARDARRGASRRSVREEAAARQEAVEPVDVTFERLAAQREVVGAVLALREPYKSVVLLHYYQGLDAAAIAARTGRSAATVRSQLSRAHEVLRAALDAKLGEDRSAWAGLLLSLPPGAGIGGAGKAGAAPAAKAVLALVLVGGAAAVLVPRWLAARDPAAGPAALADPLRVAGAEPPPPALAPASPAAAPVARAAVVVAPEPRRSAVQRAALETRSLRELLELAVQIQRANEARLLAPHPELVAREAALLALPHTGVCRILDRTADGSLEERVTVRGGGAYFSFATLSHSYDAEPDLGFGQGTFVTELAGIQLGLLAEIGDVALADLPAAVRPLPAGRGGEAAEAWDALWQDLSLDDAAHGSAFRERSARYRRPLVPTSVSSTFLLRAYSPDEHDHLVAFRPLAFDETGCTLAWRVLRTWPVPGAKRPAFDRARDEHQDVPAGPSWLAEAPLEELGELMDLVRERARPALLDVPPALVERYAAVIRQEPSSFAQEDGFARILARGRWDPLVAERGGGAYWSFLARSNSYDEAPELGLEQDRFHSGFAGNQEGLLLDLGAVSFEELPALVRGTPPAALGAREREAWDFLWTVRATVDETDPRDGRRLRDEDRARARGLGLLAGVPAVAGHSYLLRSVLFPTHDHLVVFTVVGEDEAGKTLAWRILRSWPVEQAARGR